MAQMSKLLRRLQAVEAGGNIKVVVGLKRAPDRSIARVPRSGRGRDLAVRTLASAGIGGASNVPTIYRPESIRAEEKAATLEIDVRDLSMLADDAGIEFVRPMRIHRPHLDVSVPLLGVRQSGHAELDGTGVRVAVIDSGIDASHPDLAGRVDLRNSRNFTDEGTARDVTDGNGHGTHVAAIIGGAGRQYRGVAPGVEFISCKVFDSSGSASSESAIIDAVNWAVEKHVDVINYSGGFAPVFNGQAIIDPPWVWPLDLLEEEMAFRDATEAGVVCVVSAGNEGDYGRRGTISMPATCPDVVSVGAVGKNLILSGFSSVGPVYRSPRVNPWEMVDTLSRPAPAGTRVVSKVDLVAPGGEVDRTTALLGSCFYEPGIVSAKSTSQTATTVCDVRPHYKKRSGTSQAAPHIAGLAALVVQAVKSRGLTFREGRAKGIKTVLARAAARLPRYHRREQGAGLPHWARIEAAIAKRRR